MKKQKKNNYLLGPVATSFSDAQVGTWKNVKPIVNQQACVLCNRCVQFCPTNIICEVETPGKKLEIHYDCCKGCGICTQVCKSNHNTA